MKIKILIIITVLFVVTTVIASEHFYYLANHWLQRKIPATVISVQIKWDDPNIPAVNHQYIFSDNDPGTLDDRRRPISIPGGIMYIYKLPDMRYNLKDFAELRGE